VVYFVRNFYGGEILTPSEKLYNFFSQFRLLHYKKKETLLRPYDMPSGILYLQSGYVRAYSTSREGKELTIIIFKPEDIFPYSWAISNMENKYYYEAMTSVEIRRAPKDELLSFINDNPDVLLTLSKRIVIRMMGIAQRMEYSLYGNAYQKIASMLLICAERFGKEKGGKLVIQVPLTHKDIANLVGTARETVSIELKKFLSKNLISYKGRRLVIKNRKALEKEAGKL